MEGARLLLVLQEELILGVELVFHAFHLSIVLSLQVAELVLGDGVVGQAVQHRVDAQVAVAQCGSLRRGGRRVLRGRQCHHLRSGCGVDHRLWLVGVLCGSAQRGGDEEEGVNRSCHVDSY